MTQVNLKYRRPDGATAEGALLTAADGNVRVSSVRRYDTTAGEMTRAVFTAPLGTTVVLEQGTWQFELASVSDGRGGYLQGADAISIRLVPPSGGPYDVDDLEEVTPTGGLVLEPEWKAYIDAQIADVTVGTGGTPTGSGPGGAFWIQDVQDSTSIGRAVVKAANAATVATAAGLGNVTNTSDANKPVSTAQQTALNLKADSSTVSSLSSTVGSHTTALAGKTDAATTAALVARVTALETALGGTVPPTPVVTVQDLYWNGTAYRDASNNLFSASFTRHNWYYGPNPVLLGYTLANGDTWTEAIASPPADANLITIGAAQHVLDGTDMTRGADQTIRYTYSATQTSTPTNQFGVEAVVSLSTNKVTLVNDRIATGSTAPTGILTGTYVLSAHGQGAGTAGQWLRDNAVVGATVALSAGTVVDPPPPVITDPQPGSGLAAKVVSVWHHRWSGPNLRDYPADVKSLVNHVVCGLAQSGGSGTGALSYSPQNGQSVADHATDIRAFVARGCNVLIGFGGSSDGGITITSDATADQAYNSIVSLVSTYGFNGIDIDLEPSGSNWTQSALVRLATRLKTQYGSGFIVGATPGLYDVWTARWTAFMVAAGSNVDYIAPMLYDFPEAGDSRLSSVAVQKCDAIVAAGVPQSKIILGFMMRPNAGYLNATPTVALCTNAYNASKAKYPNIRGAFVWEDLIENANSWWWTRGTGAAIAATAPAASGSITSFTATAASGTSMNLAWAYSGTATLSGWTITRSGGTGGSPQIAAPIASARSYADSGLTAGVSYVYTLRGTFTAGGTITASASGTTTSPSTPAPGTWFSGASGEGVGDGRFGTWRGTPVPLAVTWSSDNENMVNLWPLQAGFEYGSWTGHIDESIGAIESPETWAAAASGSYDARWSASLNKLKSEWTRISRGTCYIRFAHELNGNWYGWSVTNSTVSAFKTAWIRFRGMQQAIFPAAKLVLCTNGNTVGQNYGAGGWTNLWPGDAYVDVYATDFYSGHWVLQNGNGSMTDSQGAPIGLEAHRAFAQSHGKPFAVPEWGNNAYPDGPNGNPLDYPAYITYMNDFFKANGNTSPTAGKLLYEGYFNVIWSPNQFGIFPREISLAPNASDRYKQLF